MKHQLQTIRAALETVTDTADWGTCEKALTALSELERMAGEPDGFIQTDRDGEEELVWSKDDELEGVLYGYTPLYRAAPPAQQPQYEAADMASAAAQGFRDGVASVAQQQDPVAWAMPKGDGTFIDVITPAEHARDEGSYTVPLFAHPVAQQPQAEPDDEIIKERDDAEDFIDMLLDEVLGTDRPEWTSAYGRDDALRDVQERMTALHKPMVDKAWERFDKAKQPQAEPRQSDIFCGVDFADGVLAVSVLRRRPDDVAELLHSEQIELPVSAAPQQAEAVPPGYVPVPVDALHDWKGRVNTLATLSSKSDRYPFAIKLKQDIADAAIAAQGAKT